MSITNTAQARAEITLANWRFNPISKWSFQNASEIVPTAIIDGNGLDETYGDSLGDFAGLDVALPDGTNPRLPDLLASNDTDALVIMRDGRFVGEWYAPTCNPNKPHVIFSITKSVTGLLAAVLVDRGIVSYGDRVGDVVPDMVGSAYEDATLEHILDMQASVDFVDDYLDVSGGFDRYRRSMLWNLEKPGDMPETMRAFLATIKKADHKHGTRHNYHSINTDMAGIMLEMATGRRYADLVSELIWKPAGTHRDAHITVDRAGSARAAGGMSTTARDLARLGEIVRRDDAGVIPPAELDRIRKGGDRAIWANGNQAELLVGGSYKSCFYEDGAGAILGAGIYGQWLWIDHKSKTVIVRFACEALPTTDRADKPVIAMLRAISAA
jgi:CubicO group peptidase (beta-lactamase class C family)